MFAEVRFEMVLGVARKSVPVIPGVDTEPLAALFVKGTTSAMLDINFEANNSNEPVEGR
jgi:hypothetical protein